MLSRPLPAMLKAIETKYKGYRFRSRLEARWAVFFDTLGIKWEYEVEGFDLGAAGLYLPDFWLPERGWWVEIKGKAPTEIELEKIKCLSTGECGSMLLFGTPESEDIFLWEESKKDWLIIDSQSEMKNFWVWCELSCHSLDHSFHPEHIQSKVNTCPRIRHAYEAARSARFEHGETPL